MKRYLWIAAALAVMAAYPLVAQVIPQPGPATPIGCAYNSSPTTLTTGQAGWVQCASAGNIKTVTVPSTVAGATVVSTAALAANLIVNASPGNLYSFQVAADSTLSAAGWWVMIYNAASAPADGAVTPAKCYAVPAGTTTVSASFIDAGAAFTTGIVIGVSTTGCFTKTASTHAFISGDTK
jgi:hypothetical protein